MLRTTPLKGCYIGRGGGMSTICFFFVDIALVPVCTVWGATIEEGRGRRGRERRSSPENTVTFHHELIMPCVEASRWRFPSLTMG